MSDVDGKEIAEAGLIAYYDYVMRFELKALVPTMSKDSDATELVEQLMKNINTHIAEDYKQASVTVINDLGRRIGEIAKTL